MSQIQLVSRGDLDVFLTGNPSITFFKSVYRKHTNFSMEDMLISTITTLAPFFANSLEILPPIPKAPPVTKATLFLNFISISNLNFY